MATAMIPVAPDDLDQLYRMTVEEYEARRTPDYSRIVGLS